MERKQYPRLEMVGVDIKESGNVPVVAHSHFYVFYFLNGCFLTLLDCHSFFQSRRRLCIVSRSVGN